MDSFKSHQFTSPEVSKKVEKNQPSEIEKLEEKYNILLSEFQNKNRNLEEENRKLKTKVLELESEIFWLEDKNRKNIDSSLKMNQLEKEISELEKFRDKFRRTRKIDKNIVDRVKNLLARGYTYNEIALEVKISHGSIANIKQGKYEHLNG